MNINLGLAGFEILSNAKNIDKRMDYALSKLIDFLKRRLTKFISIKFNRLGQGEIRHSQIELRGHYRKKASYSLHSMPV